MKLASMMLIAAAQAKLPGYIALTWSSEGFLTSEPIFAAMAESGVKYVQLVVTQFMKDLTDTQIIRDADRTPTDESVVFAMNMIR